MREIRTSGSTRGGAPSGPLLLYRSMFLRPGEETLTVVRHGRRMNADELDSNVS